MSKSDDEIALKVAKQQEKSLLGQLEHIRGFIRLLEARIDFSDDSKEDREDTNSAEPSLNRDVPKGWDAKESIRRKLVLLLKHYKRFLHFREVADMINEIDGTTITAGDVSNAAILLKKQNKIVKYSHNNINKNTFWGVPEWLDENGTIKAGHEYNAAYLAGTTQDMEKGLFEED